MRVAIVGATKGMGRSLARLLAARNDTLFLLGRNPEELSRSAVDLKERGAAEVGTGHCDLLELPSLKSGVDEAVAFLEKIDLFVITAGLFGTQDDLEADLELAQRVLVANHAHTVILCEHARRHLMSTGGGTLCVFSSVAGDRGRKPVGIYGSSKAGISHYLESLDHKYRSEGLVTVCVKPGFVKTTMTTGLKPPPFAGEPDQVAARVLRAIDKKKPMVYAPFMWGWIMLVISTLPRFVMRKVGF